MAFGLSRPLHFIMASIREMMDRLLEVQRKIATLEVAVAQSVSENRDVLLSLNRDQMLLGRNADGQLFTPDYLSDPYFKTQAQAKSYAAMKYRLESRHKARIENALNYPDKPRDTPNLIVTGPFQDSMVIDVAADGFFIDSWYMDTPEIEQKYRNKVFGLAPLSKEYFWKHYLRIALKNYLGFE